MFFLCITFISYLAKGFIRPSVATGGSITELSINERNAGSVKIAPFKSIRETLLNKVAISTPDCSVIGELFAGLIPVVLDARDDKPEDESDFPPICPVANK